MHIKQNITNLGIKQMTKNENDQQVTSTKYMRYMKVHEQETPNKGVKLKSVRNYKKTTKQSNINKSKCHPVQQTATADDSAKTKHVTLDKDNYLLHFDSKTYGNLDEQKWAKLNMVKFHRSMDMKICLCQVCHEAWPLYVKSKKKIPYVCM